MKLSMDCLTCEDSGWVCESHIGRPWGGMCCKEPRRAKLLGWLHRVLPYRGPFRLAWRIRVLCGHGACHCGGAGYSCPSCNPSGNADWLSVIAEAT